MSLANKLAEERRARLAAEHSLEKTRSELFDANRKLSQHARKLSDEIVEKRIEAATAREEHSQALYTLQNETERHQIAEARMKEGLDIIRTGYAVFDAESRLLSANKAYFSIFDGLEEVKPGIAYWRLLQLCTEEGIIDLTGLTAADWRASMLERWQNSDPEPYVITLWNGESVQLIDRRSPEGEMVSLAMNITAQVQNEDELRAATFAAQEANRAKSAFLANMSHEIRTPMNGVVGMADLLCDTELDDEQKLYVETIKNSGDALLVIINDVLDFSKIEAGKMTINAEPFDLERCLHEVMLLLAPSVRSKGLDLVMDLDMFMPTRYVGDPGRLRQVLMNLLGNAVKFTTKGHILVRVVGLDLGDGNNSIIVNIEDTGIGIPPEKQAHVFGEFNQVEDERNRQFDGTGLGLAITQRLVKLMGGEIWVDSEVDVGSCFGFSIPMALAEDAELPRVEKPLSLRRAMIIDDQEINRRILVKQLEALGLNCQTFSSGEAALEANLGAIDVVFTDHNMPGMSGLDVIEKVRADHPDLPLVLASSSGVSPEDAHRASLATHTIQKPISRSELFALIRKLGGGDQELEDLAIAGTPTPPPDPVAEPLAAPTVAAEPEPVAEDPLPASVEDIGDTLVDAATAHTEVEAPIDAPEPYEIASPVVESDASDGMSATPAMAEPDPESANTQEVAEEGEDEAAESIDFEDPAPNLDDASLLEGGSPEETEADNALFEPTAPLEAPLGGPADIEAPTEVVPDPPTEPAVMDQTPPDITDAPAALRQMRILAAEDNKTNQLVFRKMIKALDIELKLVEDGFGILEHFETFVPDLIITDISMPGMDGKKASQEVRRLEEGTGRHVPICAMTAHAMSGDAEDILAHGLDEVLTKPLSKAAVTDMILKHQPDVCRPVLIPEAKAS